MSEHTLDESRCLPVESLLACTCGPAGGRCCGCQAALDEHDAVTVSRPKCGGCGHCLYCTTYADLIANGSQE